MADRKKVPAIAPPEDVGPSDPGYLRQCGFALEPSIHRLIEMAVGAGWARNSVLLAVVLETERQSRATPLGPGAAGDGFTEDDLVDGEEPLDDEPLDEDPDDGCGGAAPARPVCLH